ncbi:MAG TPA: ATP-binding protein [Nocardia sp.]|uniref:ATP-binding protein n=1 Tax=Nocardia sp. TaxID=1821 RepID=UPI002B4AB5A3|nr:ATP-binding protein [Nocardia sp.]HLS76504.1 ATP-binding protein [Nocardia sp.]
MNAPAGDRAGGRLSLWAWSTRQWETRPLVGMRSEPAAHRMVRRMAITVGCAGVITAVLELPRFLEQLVYLGGWVAVASIAAFALFPALTVVAMFAPLPVVRCLAGATALGYLAAAALVSFSFDHSVPESTATWMFRVFSLGVIVASVAWRATWSIIFMLVGNVGLALGVLTAIADPSAPWFFGVLFRSIGLCSLFLWCSIYAQRGAAAVDREAAVAEARAAKEAGAAARDRERARFAALIHDAVLSTLLDASRSGVVSPVLRAQAARTLDQLDALRRGGSGPERLDADSVSMFLTVAVREAAPEVAVQVTRAPGSEHLEMPVDAAGTLTAAAAEAVRNSLRHAAADGRVVHRGVDVTLAGNGVRVRVHDDGAGFDPHKVPVDRLGLSVSILGRMRSVDGGSARIESRPGQGAVVTLGWDAESAREDSVAQVPGAEGGDRPRGGPQRPERPARGPIGRADTGEERVELAGDGDGLVGRQSAGRDRVAALAAHGEGM